MRIWFLTTFALAIGGAALAQQGLEGLYLPQAGHSARSSSASPDLARNDDCRPIAPGADLVIADLAGPGVVRHIWFTVASSDPYFGRNLVIRCYWDGETTPSVESPLGDFFAVGHGMLKTVNSLPVAVSSEGRGYNCYWQMPFRRSARIVVTNEGEIPCGALYYYVDWTALPSLPRDTRLFHARYRQEYPVESDSDYLLADIVGAGHYVGTVLSIYSSEDGWPGEGDDRFYVDGDPLPTLSGTGTEDYFCDGWGFRPFTYPFYGVPTWEGFDEGSRTTVYRWHVPDPIVFRHALRATLETRGWAVRGPNGEWDGHTLRPDNFASVAYWYQTEPHKPYGRIAPASVRMPFTESRIELEQALDRATVAPGAPAAELQGGALWSGPDGGGQILFRPDTREQGVIEAPFEVAEEGRFCVSLRATTSYDYGTYRVELDGRPVGGTQDLYSAGTTTTDLRLVAATLTAGRHTLKLTCVGKNEASQGYYVGLDALVLRAIRRL